MTTTLSIEDVKAKIRSIPDFPKPGIIFRDITTGIKDAQTMKFMVEYLCVATFIQHFFQLFQFDFVLRRCAFGVVGVVIRYDQIAAIDMAY